MNASQFKAQCLAVLDEVARTGETVVILKRGKPVARLTGPSDEKCAVPQDTLKGTVDFLGDVLEPVVPEDALEILSESSS
jgi:prevent-host-death family protein